MKAIQVTFDESLLKRLDSHAAVKQRGRPTVLRDAVNDYLRRQERREIDRLYGEMDCAKSEFLGWDDEGVWP